jgi:hypothetical protein
MLPLEKKDTSILTTPTKKDILLNLILIEKSTPADQLEELITDELKAEFQYKVYAKRMEVLKLPLKLNAPALIWLLSVCRVTGHIPVFMIDCLELQEMLGVDHLTLDDVIRHAYPWGFYSDEAIGRRIDEIKQGKGKYDFIY